MLIAFGGLPGTGKTTLSRALAERIGAVHLRIDTLEQAIMNSSLAPASVEEAGYLAAYGVARDNLGLGRAVVADSVNPIGLTRDAWLAVAQAAGVPSLEVEIVCSDPAEHRRRVESRQSDLPGQRLPTWQAVETRDYRPWDRPHLVVETAGRNFEQCLSQILAALP